MTRITLVSLALAAIFLIWAHTGKVHSAVVATSLAKATTHSLAHEAGDLEYCYWKQKKSGRWKLKCDD
jgi:hypothetical protein